MAVGRAWQLEEGAKRCRETPSSPGTHALPLRRMRWCPLCPQLFRIGPGAHGCTALRHGEKPEVVSTSPSGQEAGLSTSQRTPAEICSSPPLGSGYSLIPREELNATHNSCCITHSSPNSWAADKIWKEARTGCPPSLHNVFIINLSVKRYKELLFLLQPREAEHSAGIQSLISSGNDYGNSRGTRSTFLLVTAIFHLKRASNFLAHKIHFAWGLITMLFLNSYWIPFMF